LATSTDYWNRGDRLDSFILKLMHADDMELQAAGEKDLQKLIDGLK
jgi:hypothetical protein